MKKRLLLLLISLVGLSAYVAAQQQTINGRVLPERGDTPLSGVSVNVKGTARGTQTDAEGRFTISAAPGETLVFSYVGYEPQSISVSSGTTLTVYLSESAEALGEVIVTAMGITREKRALGYAVQDIQSEDLLKNKNPNLINSLNGKIAGLNITNSGGAPGASASIIIRGGTSLERDNQPLFVIDGMPIDNSTGQGDNSAFNGTTNLSTTNSNRAMDINPEDIESISVLKGPAAAALYGLRAAAGAIIITTKKGKEGAAIVNVTPRFTTNWVNKLPEQQGMYKRGSYYNGTFTDQTVRSWGDRFASGDVIYDNMGNFFETAHAYDNSFSVSGGTATGNFFLSASNLAQSGIVPTTDFNRSTVRFNGEQKAGRFTFGVNASYAISKTQKTLTGSGLWGSSGNGFMETVVSWPRDYDMRNYINPDGSKVRIWPEPNLEDAADLENPYWVVYKNPQTDRTNRFIGSAYTTVEIADWFDVTYRLGIDNYTSVFGNLISPGSSVKLDWQEGMISETNRDYNYINSNLMLNFHTSVNDQWDFGLLLGTTSEDTRLTANSLRAQKFEIPNFISLNNATQGNQFFSQNIRRNRLVGVYGDFRASYKNIVYLNFTGRNDWSSTLPVQYQSFFYPAVSASFVFSELIAAKNVLSFGKVRASVAGVGKDASAYQTNTYLFGPELTIGGGYRNYWSRGNDRLKPESTTSFEAGAELRFFGNRLGLDAAYYINRSVDQILTPRVSNATGYILSSVNTGEIENKGFELSLTGTPVQTSDFRWDATLNFSRNRGVVKSLPGDLSILYVTDVQVGNAKAASFNEGDFMGLSGSKWQTDDDGNLLLDWNTGYPLRGTIETLPVGNREPDFIGGFNNSLDYRNWNFSFLFDFRKGGDVYNGTEHLLVSYGLSKVTENRGSTISFTGRSLNPSTGEYETVTREVVANEPYYRDTYSNHSPLFIEKVNWLRLRSVSLTYSLPQTVLARAPYIKAASISATGTNLLLLTNYSGMDPETSAAGAGVVGSGSVGVDYAGVPATAGFTLGLNVRF